VLANVEDVQDEHANRPLQTNVPAQGDDHDDEANIPKHGDKPAGPKAQSESLRKEPGAHQTRPGHMNNGRHNKTHARGDQVSRETQHQPPTRAGANDCLTNGRPNAIGPKQKPSQSTKHPPATTFTQQAVEAQEDDHDDEANNPKHGDKPAGPKAQSDSF
jgi:hypothetical protein